jgi:hypothetical protein
MSLRGKIRNLDVFRKVPSELCQPTNVGGLVSIITATLILYLFIHELQSYLHPDYKAEISL